MPEFVSRAGLKLQHALREFALDVTGKICADLGSNTGGFVDCLLQNGAGKVYAVDTGYGALDWKLRKDARVIVMERTNAMHVTLPEQMQMVTIDVAWTRQKNILPAAKRMLGEGGVIISLIKPHYEAHASLLRKGILPEGEVAGVVESVKKDMESAGLIWQRSVISPIRGSGGNTEVLAMLSVSSQST